MVQVTAIIPTYNRREWVQLAIDSVLAQRGVNLECIVVDDGSRDGTGDYLAKRYGDKIRYIYQSNQGESAARNHGAQLASGQYLAFLDSDDLWLPGKLVAQVDFLEKETDCGGVYCPAYAIDEAGHPIARFPYGANISSNRVQLAHILRSGITASGSTIMLRTQVFLGLGGYSTTIRHGEDVDFAARMLLHGNQMGVIHRPLAEVRSHTHSQSLTMQRDKFTASFLDHNGMFTFILQQTQDPAVVQAVHAARQNEFMRLLVYAIYTNNTEQVAKLCQSPELPQPIPTQMYDHQIHYFTPLIYREKQDPRAVLDFIRALYTHRDVHAAKGNRRRQDAVELLFAAVWCAVQNRRHTTFAWQQIFDNLKNQPGLLLTIPFWKLIARLLFGRPYIQLYLLWSRRFHA